MKAALFPLLFLLGIVGAAPLGAAQAPQEAPKVSLRSVQANFFQEKHLKILAQPISARGVFAFQAPRSLRWEYLYPLHTLLLVHGSDIRKLVDHDGKLVEEKSASLDAMNLALEEITNWLAGRFTENPAFSAEFPDRKRIILRPREKGLAAIISSIELHLSGSEGLLDSVIINEGQDAYTKITFSDAVLNRQLDEHLFTRP